MQPRSVHCCVTSPPYWGLRDYGTGDAQIGLEEEPDCLGWATGSPCGMCYVCHLVEVFSEVRRVLRSDGMLWLNLGDSYNSGTVGRNDVDRKYPSQVDNVDCSHGVSNRHYLRVRNLSPGDLVGIPWRVALALQADGWILRQDIIWYAPNKMPESVTNRCSKSYEHIFMFVKNEDYYFDSLAIAEKSKSGAKNRLHANGQGVDSVHDGVKGGKQAGNNDTVNKRDVWIVPTRGYPGAHFATYSPQLIEPCILAGTSEYGCCALCGSPYERIVSKTTGTPNKDRADSDHGCRDRSFNWSRNGLAGSTLDTIPSKRETVGWRKTCSCGSDEVKQCVVLDPFVGSGTTVATAIQLGHVGIGIDLSETYLKENAIPRIEAALSGEKQTNGTKGVVPADISPPPRRLR